MPIISTSEAYWLIKYKPEHNSLNEMLKTFLPMAADNIFTDIRTINIYEKFIDLFNENYKEIGSQLNIPIIDLDSFPKNNYYQSFYEYIRTQSKDINDFLITIKNDYDSMQIFYSNNEFTFLISSLSYAILTINSSLKPNQEILIKFISMILIASGYILVLCVSEKYISNDEDPIYYYPIFNEIHLFRNNEKDFNIEKINFENNPYFYVYFNGTSTSNNNKNLNNQNDNPYAQIFYISKDFKEAFSVGDEFVKVDGKYSIFKNFYKNKLLITLYNCQYFETPYLKEDWSPKDIIKFNKGYIQTNDFIEWTGERVKYFNSLNDDKPSFYIDFNEMHYLKIDHHVKNPLYLINEDSFIVDLMDFLHDNIKYSTFFIDRLKTKRSKTDEHVLEKLLYAFHKIWKHCSSDGKPVIGYQTQIYAVWTAINYLNDHVNDESNIENDKKKNRGCIFQVKTGEGKSIIINALAEAFARMKKIVHIVTSNILLASRDYEESYNYFTNCGFKSSILLHKQELDDIKNESNCQFYPSKNDDDFYNENWFDNRTGMNTKILNKKTLSVESNIIFSTFFNFEGWYLRFSEDHPTQAENYFKNCYLIIDESDTILIDEITNGTIIAREMKSNGIKVLEDVYDMHMEKMDPESILKIINEKYPNCSDVSLIDIKSMIIDIRYAHSFQRGYQYIISENNDVKHIVPFDGKQKGITEKQKEFNGFIHQFIGIKEKRKNPSLNIEIKPLSLNYKYISHPIYVNQYQCVWGFTGTIGTQNDKEILKKYYKLDTFEIPNHSTNYRKDLPTIICKDFTDRNNKIINEIKEFHIKQIPILVIFDNLSDLYDFKKILKKQKITEKSNIMIFNGLIFNKSDIENISGQKGKITLGTNFCGRGANIHYDDDFPLHVIITYGPRNFRAYGQAIGRTGRNGKQGTTRIICTIKDYFKSSKLPNDENLKRILYEFEVKKMMQSKFIKSFHDTRPWIFNLNESKKRNFFPEEKNELNNALINVNRSTAINYEFPICMSIDTFHTIQFQKIFSLKNCPECIYTWQLFQRYLRELILESWSLFLSEFTKEFEIMKIEKNMDKDQEQTNYIKLFGKKYKELETKINEYFKIDAISTMNDTFMQIHRNILKKWQDKIMDCFPKKIRNSRKDNGSTSFLLFKIGFYPYELKNKSGSRICSIDGNNDTNTSQSKNKKDKKKKKMKQINFIEDPELIYFKKDNPFSITHIIDVVFEKFCEIIDEKLSNLLGLHFFIRRGFGGCEFGVCIDPFFEQIKIDEKYCLFDLNPLIICTIQCKSEKPFLAGILMVVLFFVTIVVTKIALYLSQPELSIKDILKDLGNELWKIIKKKCTDVVTSFIEKVVRKPFLILINWLKKIITKMLYDKKDTISIIMKTILSMVSNSDFKNSGEKLKTKINIKMKPEISDIFTKAPVLSDLIKIGILILLLISAFLKSFNSLKQLKQDSNSYQKEFTDYEEFPYNHKNEDLDNFKSYKDLQSKYKNENMEIISDEII